MVEDKNKKSAPKDVDSARRSYILRVSVMFMFYSIIFLPGMLVLWGFKGFLIWLTGCVILGVLVDKITDFIGSVAGRIYTGRKGYWTLREKMESALEAVRVQKHRGNYEEALLKVEEILASDPNFMEALFVKAQILYQGYNKRVAAIVCLSNLLQKTTPNEKVYKWAESLIKEIQSD